VVQRLGARRGRADEDLELLAGLRLADVLGQPLGRSARSPDSTDSAVRGPTPLILISWRKARARRR
jgi:hypothetical protein